MSSTALQIISIVAGLALLATDYMVFYLFSPRMKLLKGLVMGDGLLLDLSGPYQSPLLRFAFGPLRTFAMSPPRSAFDP